MVLPKGLSESRMARIARRPKRRIVPNREACNKIPNRDILKKDTIGVKNRL